MKPVHEQIHTAWASDDGRALDRAVEAMAASGVAEHELADALQQLLFEVRVAGADDETEERILQVMDRLVGWCLPRNRIPTKSVTDRRPFGLAAGEFVVPDDFDALLPDDVLKQFDGQ